MRSDAFRRFVPAALLAASFPLLLTGLLELSVSLWLPLLAALLSAGTVTAFSNSRRPWLPPLCWAALCAAALLVTGEALAGGLAAVLLMILSALASRFWQSGPPKPAAWAAAFCLQVWLMAELAGTFWKALQVCREEFSSLALLGFLPLLLWAGWGIRPASWNASARVLWWFAAVGGVICLLGLAGQLHWYRLFTPAQPTGTNWSVPVYAEYFAGALLCSARSARRTVWLPVWGFAVQAAALLGGALLFGSGTYPRLERRQLFPHGCAAFAAVAAVRCLPGGHAVCRYPLALAAAGS